MIDFFLFQVTCFTWPLGLPISGWFAQDQAKASSVSFENEVIKQTSRMLQFGGPCLYKWEWGKGLCGKQLSINLCSRLMLNMVPHQKPWGWRQDHPHAGQLCKQLVSCPACPSHPCGPTAAQGFACAHLVSVTEVGPGQTTLEESA